MNLPGASDPLSGDAIFGMTDYSSLRSPLPKATMGTRVEPVESAQPAVASAASSALGAGAAASGSS